MVWRQPGDDTYHLCEKGLNAFRAIICLPLALSHAPLEEGGGVLFAGRLSPVQVLGRLVGVASGDHVTKQFGVFVYLSHEARRRDAPRLEEAAVSEHPTHLADVALVDAAVVVAELLACSVRRS